MVEAVLAFFAGIFFNYWFFGVLFFLCWIFEHNSCKVAVVFAQTFLLFVAYKVFNVPPEYIKYFLYAYLPIGFGWSVWRWLRYCREIVEDAKEYKTNLVENIDKYAYHHPTCKHELDIDTYKAKLKFRNNIDSIVSWILAWPISFVDMFLADIYEFVRSFVKNWAGRIYKYISERYTTQLDDLKIQGDTELNEALEAKQNVRK